MEHRWGDRVPLEIPVRLEFGPHVSVPGWLQNVSLSGGFVRTEVPVPALAQLHLVLEPAEERSGHRGAIAAHAVRTEPDGVGLEWYEFAPLVVRAVMSARGARSVPPAGRGRRAGPRAGAADARPAL